MKLAFTGTFDSVASFHYAQPWQKQQENYFDMVDKLVNGCKTKLYHIDVKSKWCALYVFYVITTTQMTTNHRTKEQAETNARWLRFLQTKNKQKIEENLEMWLGHEEWIKNQYEERNIDFELIDLEYYLKSRDFDHLHNLISKSYPLKTMFSNKNKELVNNEWNDRFERMNKIKLFDILY
jgi:hypothetical protein